MNNNSPPGAKGRLVPPRRTEKLSRKQKEQNKNQHALERAKKRLGMEGVTNLRNQWAKLLCFV